MVTDKRFLTLYCSYLSWARYRSKSEDVLIGSSTCKKFAKLKKDEFEGQTPQQQTTRIWKS